ncbi:MAG: prolipoprotein diacylglyceryl transferase [Clostridia bacterium]|nr:prolipoprotein diacylglyceryl transferase [Clostridia bacterium]
MHQFFGDLNAFDFFNNIALYVTIISSIFFVKAKTQAMGLYSKYVLFYVSKKGLRAKKILEYFLAFIEMFILMAISLISAFFNAPLGNLLNTGVNYFGNLFSIAPLVFIFSLIIMANPMKQMDIVTLLLPIRLFFVKLACYCQGCCWGISWKYGPYNHHYDHPGNQVPVQAIEAFWAIAILFFLLVYRKKAKTGTLFPIYMILYSGTRFFSEFFRNEENVLWIFKTYHLLCLVGIAIGLIMLLIVKIFGEKITEHFENSHRKLDLKIAQHEEQKGMRTHLISKGKA